MESNVVTFTCVVPCDQVGSLALIGIEGTIATFIAVDLRLTSDEVRPFLRSSLGECIFTAPMQNANFVTTVIFNHDLQGPLRSRSGLMKSMSRKLGRLIRRAENQYLEKMDKWLDGLGAEIS